MNTSTANTSSRAAGNQRGARTHHHDHEIAPVSFNTMNATASSPVKPMPPEAAADVCFAIMFGVFS